MKLTSIVVTALTALSAAIVLLPQSSAQTEAKKGSWEKINVHGKSLEGNLEGDSPDRDVFVYLPPSYATSPNRRYPVVYFLHGYAAHAETYWNSLSVPVAADADVANGSSREMIIVLPDAFTIYSGSMFSNSPTTGDWEAFIAHDLVAYIDGHYRTIADRSARGLAGHSMGGYGTMRIGMKHPEAFSVLYAMSSCCLMNERPTAACSRRRSESAAHGRTGERSLRASRRMGAGSAKPSEIFRSSIQGRRDPALDRRQMDDEFAFGDGRSVCAQS